MAENIVMEMVTNPKMEIMSYLLVLHSKQGLVHPLFPLPCNDVTSKNQGKISFVDKFNTCCQNSIN